MEIFFLNIEDNRLNFFMLRQIVTREGGGWRLYENRP
jgi:hypothetical protein